MFLKDWNKQKKIISLLRVNSFLKDKKLILVNDHTTDYNALKRIYRFYEWNGLFKYAYNNESRFVLNYSEVELYKSGYYDEYFNEFGNAKGYVKVDLKDAIILNIEKIEPKTHLEEIVSIFHPNFYLKICQ